MRSLTRFTLLAALLVSSACGPRNDVTAAGTVLFDWAAKDAGRQTFRLATIGERSSKDAVVTIAEADAPFSIDVHVEWAPVSFEEAGKTVEQESPVAVRATVKHNDGWDVTGACGDGPHYQMPAAGADGALTTPKGMLLDCTIKHQRQTGVLFTSSWSLQTSLRMMADGSIEPAPAARVTIE